MHFLSLLTVVALAADGSVQMEAKNAFLTWLVGGALTSVASGFFWWWMVNKFPDIFVNSIMSRIDLIIEGKTSKGKPITDKDDRQLVIRIGMALVHWSEKKLPDKGLGSRKMQLVLNKLYSGAKKFPLIGTKLSKKLQDNEGKIRQVITKFVTKMDTRLKAAEKQNKSPDA